MTEPSRDDLVVLSRLPRSPRASGTTTWWGRAFRRSADELAVDAADLAVARRLANAGRLGAIVVLPGMASVVVDPGRDQAYLAQAKLSCLDEAAWHRLIDVASGEAGFAAALEAGELPAALVEQADENGVELLPGPGDLETSCDCDAWAQPCVHALALLHQLARHLDRDPWLLFGLRGRVRGRVLADLAGAGRTSSRPKLDDVRDDAARRAELVLRLAADAPGGHGLDPAVSAYDAEIARLIGP